MCGQNRESGATGFLTLSILVFLPGKVNSLGKIFRRRPDQTESEKS
jgi:hypothetical protein